MATINRCYFKFIEKKFININNLIADIGKVKRIKKEVTFTIPKKAIAFTKK